MDKTSSSNPAMPFKPLETLPSMLHAVMIQTANGKQDLRLNSIVSSLNAVLYRHIVFNSPNKQHARALIHTNALIRTSIPAATDRFQYALDLLETDILKAKAVLTRDLNKRYHAAETAKQLAIEEEAAALAREKAKLEEEEMQRAQEEKDRLDAERLKKEQEEAELERIRKEKEEQEAKEKAEQEQREKELQEETARKAREEEEEKTAKRKEEEAALLKDVKEAQEMFSTDDALRGSLMQNVKSLDNQGQNSGDATNEATQISTVSATQPHIDNQLDSFKAGNLSDINMDQVINLDDLESGQEANAVSNVKNEVMLADTLSNNNNTNDFINFEDPSQLDNVDLFGEDPLDSGQTQQDAEQQLDIAMNNNTEIDMDLLFGDMDEPQDTTNNMHLALQNLSNADGLADTSNDLMFDLGGDGKLDMMNLDLPTHLPNENPEGSDLAATAQDDTEAETKAQTQLQTDANAWTLDNGQTFDELMQSLGDEDLNAGSNFDDLFGDIYNN